MTPRANLLAALRREPVEALPLAIQFAAAKYEEFCARTGRTDPYECFGLAYRHVPVKAPRRLPDFSPYFAGRVPDWPDPHRADFELRPFRGSAYFCMGPHNTAMNEWGEYRVFGADRDYHEKIYPLDRADCALADLERYPYPDLTAEYRYAGLAEAVERIHAQGLAAVLSWEMTVFEKAWRIRGMEPLLMDMLDAPVLAECLFDQIARRTGYLARRYAEAGVDIIQFGDDVGTQHGLMMSPQVWRDFLKPRLARIVADAKAANPRLLAFYHSDGDIEPIIGDLIDIGIDVLNPVQPECMNVADLKRRFGHRVAFWGGIGAQTVLPFGTPAEVAAAVRQLVLDAGPTGLVISPGHLIERDVPWENIEAFVAAARDYGRVGLK